MEIFTNGVVRSKFNGATGTVDLYGSTATSCYYNGGQIWHAANGGAGSGLDADLLDGQYGSYYLAFGNFTGQASDAQLPPEMGAKRFNPRIAIGDGVTPSGNLASRPSVALGDSDTGIAQNGDGTFQIYSDNTLVLNVKAGNALYVTGVSWLYVNGKPAAGVSTSSARDQTDFPIGTVLAALTNASNVDRNTAVTLALSGSVTSDFQATDRAGDGTALAGTWLCCGRISNNMHAFRRSTL